MAFDLDGLAVLKAMAAKPDVFAGIEAEAAKIARTLLSKLLKDKATGLTQARAMVAVLPEGTLAHITDAMTDAEIAVLATRLDRLNLALKAADRHAKAGLIEDLVAGRALPAIKVAPATRKSASTPAPGKKASSGVEAAKKVLNSRAMGARKATTAAGA